MTIPTVPTLARVADVSDSGAVNVAVVRRGFPAVVIIDDENKAPGDAGPFCSAVSIREFILLG
jgi:hypothetical protein